MSSLLPERNKLKLLREEFKRQEQLLQEQYDDQAKKLCPFKIDDEIEYEPGKKGKVHEIYYPKDWDSLENQEPDNWEVTGIKIKKNGSIGKKNYIPISNKTHIINGNSCRIKTIDEFLGIK